MSEHDAPLFGEEIATVTEEGTVFGRHFEHVPSPIDIVLRGSSRMNASAGLNYSEISSRGKMAGVMDPRHLLAYLRSHFPRESNQTFEQAAPLTQRDLLRMHHAVSKSDDIVLTVRRHCILFQIDPIKAIILADRVFLFNDLQDDEHALFHQEIVESLCDLWQNGSTEGKHDSSVPKRAVSTTHISKTSQQLKSVFQKHTTVSASTHLSVSHPTSPDIGTLDILLRFVLENLTTNVHDCINEVRRIHRLMTKTFFLPANVAEKIRRVKTHLVKQQHWIQSCHRRLQYLSEDDEEMGLMKLSSHGAVSVHNKSVHQQHHPHIHHDPDSIMSRERKIHHHGVYDDLGVSSTRTVANDASVVSQTPNPLNSSPSLVPPTLHRSRSLSTGNLQEAYSPSSPLLSSHHFHDSGSQKRTSLTGLFPVLSNLSSSSPPKYSKLGLTDASSHEDLMLPLLQEGKDDELSSVPTAVSVSTLRSIPVSSSTIVEDLLELYIIELAALAGRVNHHVGLIVNAEETIQLRLSTIENELLLANTNFMLLQCALSFGMYLTGVGGMNLNNDDLAAFPHGFAMAAGGSAGLIVVSFIYSKWYFDVTGILPTRVTKTSGGPLHRRHLFGWW